MTWHGEQATHYAAIYKTTISRKAQPEAAAAWNLCYETNCSRRTLENSHGVWIDLGVRMRHHMPAVAVAGVGADDGACWWCARVTLWRSCQPCSYLPVQLGRCEGCEKDVMCV